MEVSQPKYELRKATTALTRAHTMLHSFRVEPVGKALVEGQKVVMDVQEKADSALAEHGYWRVWLSASLVPILIVVGLLLLYIRMLPLSKSPPDSL